MITQLASGSLPLTISFCTQCTIDRTARIWYYIMNIVRSLLYIQKGVLT